MSKMTLEEILKLTYWWCQDLDQVQIKHEVGLAESTGVDWDSFCREVCEITLLENSFYKTSMKCNLLARQLGGQERE